MIMAEDFEYNSLLGIYNTYLIIDTRILKLKSAKYQSEADILPTTFHKDFHRH